MASSKSQSLANLVPLKNSLALIVKKGNIIDTIVSQIVEIPEFSSLKGDLEIAKYVCNIVEHLVSKKSGIDKQDIVVQALTKVFNLNYEEQAVLRTTIQFLWDNKQIKKVGNIKIAMSSIGSWVTKKFL